MGQAPLVGLEVGISGKEEGNLGWAIPMGSCHKDKERLSDSSALDTGSFWQVGEWSRVKAGSSKSLLSRTIPLLKQVMFIEGPHVDLFFCLNL